MFVVFSANEFHKSFPGWRLQIWVALRLSANAQAIAGPAAIGLIAFGAKKRAGKMAAGNGILEISWSGGTEYKAGSWLIFARSSSTNSARWRMPRRGRVAKRAGSREVVPIQPGPR